MEWVGLDYVYDSDGFVSSRVIRLTGILVGNLPFISHEELTFEYGGNCGTSLKLFRSDTIFS